MLNPTIHRLTDITQKCFADESEHLANLMGIVGDVWTILDLLPKHNIYISAKADTQTPQKLLLTVGRTDFQSLSLGTLVQKQYEVTQRQTYLNVDISHIKVDDVYPERDTPRKLLSQNLYAEAIPPERLTAILIEDIKEFMKPEHQIHLGNRLDLQISDSPIITAMKSAFPAEWQPFGGHDKNAKNAPQSTPDGSY